MKEILLQKRKELQESLAQYEHNLMIAKEQMIMCRGALQYNEMLLKELEKEEISEEKENGKN